MANEWAESNAEVQLRLQRWIDGEAAGPTEPHIRPFTNDHVPAANEAPAAYITDASLTCPDDTVPGDQWGSITFSSGIAQTVHDLTRTWTRTSGSGSIIVYGYYVLSDDLSEVRWAERFADPRTLFVSDAIDLTAARRERTTPSS